MKSLPLAGIKVVDVSSVLAGPLTGSFFAEMGAEVIKIENRLTGGDVTKQWKLPIEDPSCPYSAYYFSANYGKETLLLDLTDPLDRAQLEAYIEKADIVISNYQQRTARKLDLDPYAILKRYPALIFVQLNAYAWNDPRPGYDLVMQGETGWISMTGTDGNHLAKLPVALIDIIASHQMRTACLLGLIKKGKSGKGSLIHVSLYKSAISALANQASNFLMNGTIPEPLGTLHPNIAPYGDIFVTKDQEKIMLAIGSDHQFEKLWFSLIKDEDLYRKFELNSDRVLYRRQLAEALQGSIGSINFKNLSLTLDELGLPYCLVHNLQEVFEASLAKEMILTSEIDQYKSRSVSSIAFEIEEV